VVEDPLAEAVADREAVRRGQIDPDLPFGHISGGAPARRFNQTHS